MTPRDFIVTPSSWLTDHVLNALSDDAELLFRRLASCTDKHWRFPFDPTALEHSVRTAVYSPKRRFRAWNPDRIQRCLNELTAAGMLIRHYQGDRYWLQVAEQYRYEKGRDPLGIEKPAQQSELPVSSPSLFAMPPPNPAGTANPAIPSRTHDSGRGGIPKRTESEQSTANDSTRDAKFAGDGEGTQKLRGRGDSDARFARREEDVPDDSLWTDLIRTVGMVEMSRNGAMWERRLHTSRHALQIALQDFLTKPPEERGKYNPAAYITAAYENENRKAS